jgi:hypothetical protein
MVRRYNGKSVYYYELTDKPRQDVTLSERLGYDQRHNGPNFVHPLDPVEIRCYRAQRFRNRSEWLGMVEGSTKKLRWRWWSVAWVV